MISDHADENLISPRHYRRYCIPFYQQAGQMLYAAEKFVSTHLDGNFKGFFHLLAETGFDLLDGCTPSAMFNYEVKELAAALPDGMRCYLGVPSTLFVQSLPTDVLVSFAHRIVNTLDRHVIWKGGDILPAGGDIELVIAIGTAIAG